MIEVDRTGYLRSPEGSFPVLGFNWQHEQTLRLKAEKRRVERVNQILGEKTREKAQPSAGGRKL
jgi:hypothetical protein